MDDLGLGQGWHHPQCPKCLIIDINAKDSIGLTLHLWKLALIVVERAKWAKPVSTFVEITPCHYHIERYYVDTRVQEMSKIHAVAKSTYKGP